MRARIRERTGRRWAAMLCCAVLIVLSGCAGVRDRQAEQDLFDAVSPEADWGEAAVSYLEYLQGNLPRRTAGTNRELEAAAFLLDALRAMGYGEEITIQPFLIQQDPSQPETVFPLSEELPEKAEENRSQNLILTIPGQRAETILVGAHYDSVQTNGADDNGSGVSVLLESALRSREKAPRYTIRYVFFGAEEQGMRGSQHYVRHMTEEEREALVCMVNVDSVLAGDYRYVLGGAEQADGTVGQTEFLDWVMDAARSLDLDVRRNETGARFPIPMGTQKSDHYAFSGVGVPYVYFWADNLETAEARETERLGEIMHTENDDLEKIRSYFPGRAEETLAVYSRLLYEILTALP